MTNFSTFSFHTFATFCYILVCVCMHMCVYTSTYNNTCMQLYLCVLGFLDTRVQDQVHSPVSLHLVF